ncbi:MAG: hypothetical protein ACO219_04445 [Holophagaceae bacterium]|jgi:uncharacterized protein YabN with tetrapyrrole methylase and pyrophosphatase domain
MAHDVPSDDPSARPRSLLDHIPDDAPVLDQAREIGRRCAEVGFEWATAAEVMTKVEEELRELQNETSRERQTAELGDVLFSLAQWARKQDIDPREALRLQMIRFKARFREVERLAEPLGGVAACSLEQLESFWQASKRTQP